MHGRASKKLVTEALKFVYILKNGQGFLDSQIVQMPLRKINRIEVVLETCYLKLPRSPMVGTPHIPKFENEHQLGHIHGGTSLVERIDLGVYRMLFLGC